MLQVILHQRPRQQVVLKCPDHLWFIDPLLKVFPDACIVQTHRDPLQSIASYASMISLHERTFHGRIDWHDMGQRVTEHFHTGLSRAHASRSGQDPKRFYDVLFTELVKDPVLMVQKISDYFGIEAPTPESLHTQLSTKRADRPGAHRYSTEQFGLDPTAVKERFRWYTEAYNVPLKQPA
jgi:hypothetical protein